MPREFSAEELKRCNGLEGNPAYVAFKGKVYDVSEVFVNGDHSGVEAGQDITQDFEDMSPHEEKIFLKYDVVGNYGPTTKKHHEQKASDKVNYSRPQ